MPMDVQSTMQSGAQKVASLPRKSSELLLSTLLTLSLAACSSGGGASASLPSCSTDGSPSKVQLGDSDLFSVSSSRGFDAGTKINLVVRDTCDAPGELVAMIAERFEGSTPSGVRSYEVTLPAATSLSRLREMADNDSCIELVTAAGDGFVWNETYDQALQDSFQFDTTGTSEDSLNDGLALPNDPKASSQLHLKAIGASSAYDIFYHPTSGIKRDVVIAVVDSGVLTTHEDLRANLWVNKREIPGNGRDDDRNGYVDDVNGYNFVSRIGNPAPQRTSANGSWQWAHGTKVAGLAAAAAGNSRGGTGVMGTAKIMALNNMGRGSSMPQSASANAIRYAVDNGADVINLSFGGFSSAGTDLTNALKYAVSKGVVVLAAAGNESTRISTNYSAAGRASGLNGLVSIGNFVASTMRKSSTSNYSTTYVELGAPGMGTTSTGLYTTSPSSTRAYTYFSGTSAATPVAAGAAALAVGLVKSRGYNVSASEIENLLIQSAKRTSALTNYFKNGNALDLNSLAKLINARYPAIGRSPIVTAPGGSGSGETTPPNTGSTPDTNGSTPEKSNFGADGSACAPAATI